MAKTRQRYAKIGKRFKDLRTDCDIGGKPCTQDMLSKQIHIQKPQISELENGKRLPSINELKAYSRFFNVPMEYLLGESNSKCYENIFLNNTFGLTDGSIEQIKKFYEWSTSDFKNEQYSPIAVLNYILSYKNGKLGFLLAAIIEYLKLNEKEFEGIDLTVNKIIPRLNLSKAGMLYTIQRDFMNIVEDMGKIVQERNDSNGEYPTKKK